MTKVTRRTLLASSAAAVAARGLPKALSSRPARRILTLVRDKAAGGLRAVERVVR